MLPELMVLVFGQLSRLPRGAPPPRKLPPLTTSIDLVVRPAGGGEVRCSVPPGSPPPVRPAVPIRPGQKPQIRWAVKNLDARSPVRDVVVHFLIHAVSGPDEPIPAEPRKGSFADQVLGTSLAPRQSTLGTFHTAVYQPGYYLVELELLDPTGTRRQYAAVYLKVGDP